MRVRAAVLVWAPGNVATLLVPPSLVATRLRLCLCDARMLAAPCFATLQGVSAPPYLVLKRTRANKQQTSLQLHSHLGTC